MENIQRDDIHLIARHSNLTESGVDKALRDQVYPKADAWRNFLRLFFLIFGVGFSLMGIIFFFAYNWADLHKFAKIGLIEGLLTLVTAVALYPKINRETKKIMLSGSSLLVGLLFAVFGQVYQTGANAYDFFLAWTLFISIWVLVANFTPLWLFFLILINITLILYEQQVASNWSPVLFYMGLSLINAGALLLGMLLPKTGKNLYVPTYFTNIVALAAVSFATIGIVTGIFNHTYPQLALSVGITGTVYAFGISYALKKRSGFYLAIFPFSLIIIISAGLLDISDDEYMFLTVSGFIIASVTFVVRNLIKLQKTNTHGKEE